MIILSMMGVPNSLNKERILLDLDLIVTKRWKNLELPSPALNHLNLAKVHHLRLICLLKAMALFIRDFKEISSKSKRGLEA